MQIKYHSRDKGNVIIGVKDLKDFKIVSVNFKNGKGLLFPAYRYAEKFITPAKFVDHQKDFITNEFDIYFFTDNKEKFYKYLTTEEENAR